MKNKEKKAVKKDETERRNPFYEGRTVQCYDCSQVQYHILGQKKECVNCQSDDFIGV